MVTCLNNPPGKKVVPRALRRASFPGRFLAPVACEDAVDYVPLLSVALRPVRAHAEHLPHSSLPVLAQRPHALAHHFNGCPPQQVERQVLENRPPVASPLLCCNGPAAREDLARFEPSLHRARRQGLLGQRDPLRQGPFLRLIGPSGQLPEGHHHLTRGHWGHIQSGRPLPCHRVQTWVLDHAFVVLDDLLHQIRWLGLGLRLGPGVHEEPVHVLNNPPGKKVVARAGPPSPDESCCTVVGSSLRVQLRLKPSPLYSGLYSFWLNSCVQVRLKPSLNPILPNP